MKAVILGAGFAGRSHAAALRAAGVEIAAVITSRDETARAFAAQWNIPAHGTDIALALAADVDVVHICTPPTTHGPLIRQLLAAGKHVVCEKPLSLDVEEAARVPAMTTVARLHGPAVLLLRAERVILNFITHLSGIANLTARYVQELEGTGVRLLDTRKTTPGLRWPEKYAVQAGGGCNHRKNLVEMLMLKDNHIDAAGSIGAAVRQLRERYSPCPPIEVECRTLDHVRAALDAGADRIMMDNMDSPLLSQALALVPPHVETEVSGGVRLETIRAIALTGPRRPDFISVGRLTHSAVAADFSMTLESEAAHAARKDS